MAGSDKNVSGFRNSECRRTPTSMRETELADLPEYFELEHEEDVLYALEAIEADVTLGRPIRWKELLLVIRVIMVIDETAPDCLNFAKALLGLFERYQCRDMSVRSEVFRLLLSVTEPDHPFLSRPMDFTEIFLSPYGKGQTNMDLVFSAARCGNLSLLKLQLKFGLGMAVNGSPCSRYLYCLLHAWPLNLHVDEEADEEEDDENSIENPTVALSILREISNEMIEKNFRCNFNPESMKRLGLVFRMVDLVREMKIPRPDCRERFAECYRLLFESIPAAFVTSVEVKASLEKCLPASCSPFISRITEDYKNLLPDLAEVPQPRSLQHLCRIEVRQSLRENLNLPHGVAPLPLPTMLKKYILLNDDGDYRVVIRSCYHCDWRRNHYRTINIPEDDCVAAFLKNL